MLYDEELARMRARMLAKEEEEPPVFDDGARFLGQDPNMMQVGLFGRPKKPAAPPTAPPVNLQRRSILGLTPMPAELPAVIPPAQPKLTPQQMEQAVKPQATFPGPHPDVWAGGPSFMSMGDLGDVVKRYTEKNYPASQPATPAEPSANPLQSLADKALNAPMSRRDVLQRAGQAALQQVIPMPSITDVVPQVMSPLAEVAQSMPPSIFTPNPMIDNYLKDFARMSMHEAYIQEPGSVAQGMWILSRDYLKDKLPKDQVAELDALAKLSKQGKLRKNGPELDEQDAYELYIKTQNLMRDLRPHEVMDVLGQVRMHDYDEKELYEDIADHFKVDDDIDARVSRALSNKRVRQHIRDADERGTSFGNLVSSNEFENYINDSYEQSQKDKAAPPKALPRTAPTAVEKVLNKALNELPKSKGK